MELRRLTDEERIARLKSTRQKKIFKNRKELDCEQLEQLCRIQCTREEVASVLGMCEDSLYERMKDNYAWFGFQDGEPTHYVRSATFGEVFEKFSKEGTAALRRAQFKAALKGENTTMQIWLGKQLLGQTDRPSDATVSDKEQVEYDIREKLYDDPKDAA